MASTIIFVDSFDHYTTNAQFLTKWTNGANTPNPTAVGRNGTNGVRLNGSGSSMLKGFANAVEGGICFAWKPSALGSYVLRLWDTATTQVYLELNGSGQLVLRRGDGTVLGTSTPTMSLGVFYDIEVRWLIDNATGELDLIVNGDTWLSLSGIDTNNGAGAFVNMVGLYGVGGADDFDDVVIYTGDTLLGPSKVEYIAPSGNGTTSDLVGSDADSTDNYLLVDEATPDGDTTFVESSTPGDKDTYEYDDLSSATGAVLAVQISAYARKTDGSARSIVTIARSGGGTEEDSVPVGLPSTYAYLSDVRPTKPGGGAWTVADVNAAEFGAKVDA